MEEIRQDSLLRFHKDTLHAVRRKIGLDEPGKMEEAVNMLDNWVKKQAHFVKKDFSKEYLERILLTTKGSVERAKQQLDKLCTLKTLMPEFFADDMDVQKVIEQRAVINFHLPTQTKEHNRVYLFKILLDYIDSKSVNYCSKYFVMVAEYLRKYDYSNSYVIVADFRGDGSPINLVTKVNPVELKHTMTLMIEGYGLRIHGIHIITDSKMVDTIVSLFKQIISDKVANRIHIHKDLDTLYEFVPRDLLPVEYGGKEMPLKDLQEKWINEITSQENMEYYKEMYKACTNESYRQPEKFNESYTGMPGSFRALSVD